MKTSILAVACAFAWSAVAQAQDTHDKIIDEMLPAFTKLSDALATIKDRKSADEAKPKIKDIAKTMTELKDRADKLGEPKAEKKEELEKKYKEKLTEATKKMAGEMIRIATQVEGGQEIVKEISELLAPLSRKKK